MTNNISFFQENIQERPVAGLYIVATPIGNLRDISLRALDILLNADLIACEDTRVTAKLKNAYGLKAPLVSYHEHNEEKATEELIKKLSENKVIALVSDAGTPLMSDPGYRIVKECIKNNIKVFSVPGACASITAITLSGLPVNRFLFNGFLPSKQKARKDELQELAKIPATLIFYESNHRLEKTLIDMLEILGNRKIAIAREMTKKFEEIKRGNLKDLVEFYKTKEKIKGEVTLVVAPPLDKIEEFSNEEITNMLKTALKQGKKTKEIAEETAKITGIKKRELYNKLQELKNNGCI